MALASGLISFPIWLAIIGAPRIDETKPKSNTYIIVNASIGTILTIMFVQGITLFCVTMAPHMPAIP